MTSLSTNQQTSIIITERGLTISGTRITLYDVMDYIIAHYPPAFIQSLFDLTVEQLQVALDYIESHREIVEAEYQRVLQESKNSVFIDSLNDLLHIIRSC